MTHSVESCVSSEKVLLESMVIWLLLRSLKCNKMITAKINLNTPLKKIHVQPVCHKQLVRILLHMVVFRGSQFIDV